MDAVAYATYSLDATTDIHALCLALRRLPEQRAQARCVSDRESCTLAWQGGACGWDRREGKGLWITVTGQPYPNFYGTNANRWRPTLLGQLARQWLALQPRTPTLAVFADYLTEQGLMHPQRAVLEQALTFRHGEGILGRLAVAAVEAATDTERGNAERASRA